MEESRSQPHGGRAPGQKQKVSGNDRRCIDQAEARHTQHAMDKVRAVIALQILVDETGMIGDRASLRAGRFVETVGVFERVQVLNSRRAGCSQP